jgi:hypothetical protein
LSDEKKTSLDDFAWPFTLELRKPVTVKGEKLDVLSLTEPTTNHMLKYGVLDGSTDGRQMIELIAELAGAVNGTQISRELHPNDYFKLQKQLTDFFRLAAAD